MPVPHFSHLPFMARLALVPSPSVTSWASTIFRSFSLHLTQYPVTSAIVKIRCLLTFEAFGRCFKPSTNQQKTLHSRKQAPVVQWREQRTPNAPIEVRFFAGARAYSKTALRAHGMGEVGVQLPVGPPIINMMNGRPLEMCISTDEPEKAKGHYVSIR